MNAIPQDVIDRAERALADLQAAVAKANEPAKEQTLGERIAEQMINPGNHVPDQWVVFVPGEGLADGNHCPDGFTLQHSIRETHLIMRKTVAAAIDKAAADVREHAAKMAEEEGFMHLAREIREAGK